MASERRSADGKCRPFGPKKISNAVFPRPHGRGYLISARRAFLAFDRVLEFANHLSLSALLKSPPSDRILIKFPL